MHHKLPPFFTRLRFATAMVSTWLMNLKPFGFSLKSVCTPGFNCHGCAYATSACPIGVMAFGSAVHALPVMAIATILAVGALLGRLVCGFLCPFGWFQDLLHRIPGPKIRLPRWFRYGKYLVLLLLVFVLPYLLGFDPGGFLSLNKPEVNKAEGGTIDVKVAVRNFGTEPVKGPLVKVLFKDLKDEKNIVFHEQRTFPDITVPPGETVTLPSFQVPNHLSEANLVLESPQSEVVPNARYQLYFCRLCPNGTLTATIPGYFGANTTPVYKRMAGHWLRLSILAVFLVLMVIASRPFCRGACPLGAIYAMTTRVAVSRMTLDPNACVHCGMCNKVCPAELDVPKEVGGMECIACGDCMKVCPKHGIRRQFGP